MNNTIEKLPKILTLLFLDSCPLNCRYCFVGENINNKMKPPGDPEAKCFSYDFLDSKIQDFIDLHKEKYPGRLRVLLTGGEPFLQWPILKKLIEKFNTIQFEFNTSGYLLTDEILEFLYHYDVLWNLSVDGPRDVARYQRPMNIKGAVPDGYWERFEKIVPSILFYYPNITWKTILSSQIAFKASDIYLSAWNKGFKRVRFTLDLNDIGKRGSIPEYFYKEFEEQIKTVCICYLRQIVEGHPPVELNLIEEALRGLTWKLGDPLQIKCGISEGRFQLSIHDNSPETKVETEDHNCLSSHARELNEENPVEKTLNLINNGTTCPRDSTCEYWKTCIEQGCIQHNYEATNNCLILEESECKIRKIIGENVKIMLQVLLNINSENTISYLQTKFCERRNN